MHLHFFDTRTQVTICEIDGAEVAPRVGDTVSLLYRWDEDEPYSAMWRVIGVTWNYDLTPGGLPLSVDVELTPYEEGDWRGTADAMLDAVAYEARE